MIWEIDKRNRQDIIFAQKAWIRTLGRIAIQPVTLSDTWRDGVTPGKRFPASHDWRYPYQYRVCLYNEIPYDLDVKDYDLLKICLEPLFKYLEEASIPYLSSGSGGTKSIHVQIFFKPSVLCVRYGWKEVREALWEWVLDQANIPKYMRGLGKYDSDSINKNVNFPYDKSVANFSDLSKGRVMRDFGGYREGKYHKTLLIGKPPAKREDIYDGIVRFPDSVHLWDADKIIRDELEFAYELKYPKWCAMCPVDPEWMIQFDEQLDKDGCPTYISDHPKVCRDCGRYRRD